LPLYGRRGIEEKKLKRGGHVVDVAFTPANLVVLIRMVAHGARDDE
jgi:hypothetical protein